MGGILGASGDRSWTNILLRLAMWSAAIGVLFWIWDQKSDAIWNSQPWVTFLFFGVGVFCGQRWVGATGDFTRRTGWRFSDSPTGEISRAAFWLLVICFGEILRAQPPTESLWLNAIQRHSAILSLIGFSGLVLSLFPLGVSWRARRRGDTYTLRIAIGLRLMGIAIAGGGVWLLASLLPPVMTRSDTIVESNYDGTFDTLVVGGVGAAFLIPILFGFICFGNETVCARFDRFRLRKHCHRWADLTSVVEENQKLTLSFSDGGQVVALAVMSGYRDLLERSRAVLDQRNDDNAK